MFNNLISLTTILMAGLLFFSLPIQAAQTAAGTQAIKTSAPQNSLKMKTVSLSVPGMTCPVCPITVKKALKNVIGVNKVVVDFDKKIAVVTFDPNLTKISDLTKATKEAGYPAQVNK